jgi:hypothetical protein
MLSDNQQTRTQDQGSSESEISPELVRKVADRVYRLLCQEARIDYERRRPLSSAKHFRQGGR